MCMFNLAKIAALYIISTDIYNQAKRQPVLHRELFILILFAP